MQKVPEENIKMCRFCLYDESKGSELEIVNVCTNEYENLVNKIQKCTSIQLREDDLISPFVCVRCIEEVYKIDEFLEQCKNAEAVLINRLHTSASASSTRFQADVNSIKSKESFFSLQESRRTPPNNVEINKQYVTNVDYCSESSASSVVLRKTKSDSNILPNYMRNDDFLDKNDSWDSDDDNLDNSQNEGVNGSTLHQIQPIESCLRKKHGDFASNERKKVRIYEMDQTMKNIIGDNNYVCDICMCAFPSFFEYYDHQETHNGKYLFKCSKCTKVFCERKKLVEHDSKHKVPCKICSIEVLPKSMAAHVLIHTDLHKCKQCGLRHTSSAALSKHFKARHAGIKGFVCHICGKQSSCQSSLNRHMAYHSNERPYKCQFCQFTAKSVNIVQVHTSRIHSAKKVVCEVCTKIFKSQPSLLQHMKRIHTPKKHECNVCGKCFIERYNLNKHLQKHAKFIHECKVCLKEFFTVRKLKEHMHSHRQGCVNCPTCGKLFFYKKYLDKHINKCTGEAKDNKRVVAAVTAGNAA